MGSVEQDSQNSQKMHDCMGEIVHALSMGCGIRKICSHSYLCCWRQSCAIQLFEQYATRRHCEQRKNTEIGPRNSMISSTGSGTNLLASEIYSLTLIESQSLCSSANSWSLTSHSTDPAGSVETPSSVAAVGLSGRANSDARFRRSAEVRLLG